MNATEARIDPSKLTGYALNPNHHDGGHKALVFDRVLGYDRSNFNELLRAILDGVQTAPARPGLVNQDGVRFGVDIVVQGPTGRTALVRTGWIYRPGESFPRLTTAFIRQGEPDANTTAL